MPLAVGQKARRSATLTAEHVRLYSEITGDYNPLHVDAEFTAFLPFTSRHEVAQKGYFADEVGVVLWDYSLGAHLKESVCAC